MDSLDLLTPQCLNLLHKHQLLKSLVEAEIVESKINQIQIEDENKLINDLRNQKGIKNDKAFEEWLKANNLTQQGLKQQLSRTYKFAEYCKSNYIFKAEERFLKRKGQLDQVIYSLLRVKDPYKARELHLQIADGEKDFSRVAEQYSEGPEKETKGIVGPVSLEQAHPRLVQFLSSSKPGQLSQPIATEGWYLVIRLESYREAKLNEQMREKMAMEIFNDWLEEEVGRKIEVLLAKAKSEITDTGNS